MPGGNRVIAGKAYAVIDAEDQSGPVLRQFKKAIRGLRRTVGPHLVKLRQMIQGISRSLQTMGRRMLTAGTAGMAAMGGAAKMFASAGDALHKMSARTGVSVEALSELGHAAELSGTSLDTVGQAIQKMNRRIGRMTAGAGSKNQIAAVEELGLSLAQLEKMNPEEQFNALADAISSYGNTAQAAGLAQRAFGTQVDQLLPMFADGSSGIAKMRKEARELGITLTDADAEAAAQLTDAFARLWSSTKAVTLQIGAGLAESLTSLISRITPIVSEVVAFVKNNRELVATLGKVAAGVTAAGAAILATGVTLSLFATTASSVGGLIAATFAALASGPVLAFGAAVAALSTPFWDTFSYFSKVGSEAFQKVLALFRAGRIEDALQITVNVLKSMWQGLVTSLEIDWLEFTVQFKVAYLKSVNVLSKAMIGFASFFQESWHNMLSNMYSGLAWLAGKAADLLKHVNKTASRTARQLQTSFASGAAGQSESARQAVKSGHGATQILDQEYKRQTEGLTKEIEALRKQQAEERRKTRAEVRGISVAPEITKPEIGKPDTVVPGAGAMPEQQAASSWSGGAKMLSGLEAGTMAAKKQYRENRQATKYAREQLRALQRLVKLEEQKQEPGDEDAVEIRVIGSA